MTNRIIDEADTERFFGNEGAWRNDEHPGERGESPTVSTIVKYSTDGPLGSTEHYTYYVHHVRGHHGKGFMPSVMFLLDRPAGNGRVTYGTDAAAYETAKLEGERYMDDREEEFRQERDAAEAAAESP